MKRKRKGGQKKNREVGQSRGRTKKRGWEIYIYKKERERKKVNWKHKNERVKKKERSKHNSKHSKE